jgi:DNA-binding response OmpR family regulator
MGLRSETFGNWTLFHRSSLVVLAGEPGHAFELSEWEFSLAITLFRNLGRVVSRHELLEATNQVGCKISTRILDNQIFKMRKTLSLEDNGITLQAVYAKGYRLVVRRTALAPVSVPRRRPGVASPNSA